MMVWWQGEEVLELGGIGVKEDGARMRMMIVVCTGSGGGVGEATELNQQMCPLISRKVVPPPSPKLPLR